MNSTNREDDGFDISKFLKISQERRKQAWIQYDERQRKPEPLRKQPQEFDDLAA
jgi:hypothetical protein